MPCGPSGPESAPFAASACFLPMRSLRPTAEPRCGLCRRIDPAFARAVAYGSYEAGLRELIHLLKYAGVRPAANVLGRMLAEAIAELEPELPADPIAVIPVPLHRTKLRQREFNHAELIARAAMKLSPVPGRLQLMPECSKENAKRCPKPASPAISAARTCAVHSEWPSPKP